VLLANPLISCGVQRHDARDPQRRLSPGDHEISLEHGGRMRHAIVHIPAIQSAPRFAVMLAFHGGGGEAEGFQAYAGLDRVADREGFVVVYPFGTGPLPRRLLTFNAGECCGYASDNDVDDVGFTMTLLARLAEQLPIDLRRVYATGHSNGAMMAYRLAAERADRIAAIVPVAGAMQVPTFAPSRPVPVLHIHSADDPRALYDGGVGPPFPLTDRRVKHRSVNEALDQWRLRNGCPAKPRIEGRRERDDQTAVELLYVPCASGADVAHWRLTGVGHGWPGSNDGGVRESIIGPTTNLIDAAEEAWRFASRFVAK
jgi:polyhydroxybutyrate depolymerase